MTRRALAIGCGGTLAGGGWVDHGATWIASADAATGEQVTFGAPGAPAVDLGGAIAASWAIPGWFPPVRIGGRRYVDGGAVSSVSADLLADHVDEVIVLAPMTSEAGAAARGADQIERLLRSQMTRGLDREVADLRAAGVRVIRVEPTETELTAMGPNFMDVDRRAATIAAARAAAGERIAAVKSAFKEENA